MELKQNQTTAEGHTHELLIAPSWNWNYSEFLCRRISRPLLIAPSWNWNLSIALLWVLLLTSNRTIVELKRAKNDRKRYWRQLLIAPSWNWNKVAPSKQNICTSSNRTIVELKLVWGLGLVQRQQTSNRTIVELKPEEKWTMKKVLLF